MPPAASARHVLRRLIRSLASEKVSFICSLGQFQVKLLPVFLPDQHSATPGMKKESSRVTGWSRPLGLR